MKLPSFLAAVLTVTAFAAHAEVSPINLAVEQINKSGDAKPPAKGKPSPDKTQTRSLKIRVTNISKEAFDGLVIKYWFLGHGMSERAVKVIVEGERKVTLAARGTETVESEIVTKQYAEAHNAPAAAAKAGTPAKTTKVAASGEKLMGCAVRAIKDGKVLGEYYSESGYKEIIDKAAGAPSAPAAAVGAKPAVKK